ncbi:uncharacterized protein DFE_2304 [Desulfovibrio ferrophilus]|uniref:Uncharacterized protein n=1 Tax=Desulfovibrio ferrophilus TaxID=241368 RepID=A0A2Z6B0S0_9BACT|nr:uncharacterized protein DFE_2304 [Desulfovibrio ferrophilus]
MGKTVDKTVLAKEDISDMGGSADAEGRCFESEVAAKGLVGTFVFYCIPGLPGDLSVWA